MIVNVECTLSSQMDWHQLSLHSTFKIVLTLHRLEMIILQWYIDYFITNCVNSLLLYQYFSYGYVMIGYWKE